jgi:hypothetical protein
VLADCAAQDDETTASFETGLAYGRNRRALEAFCADHFDRCLIVRLPALFGTGLKKNFLFDIMNPMPSLLAEAPFAELNARLPPELRAGLPGLYAWNDSLGLFAIDRTALAATGRRAAYDAAVTELGLSAARFTSPESCFQYYDMARLWADIGRCVDREIGVIHLAPEPLEAGAIHAALTGRAMAPNGARVRREEMWTRHADLFGREGPFIAGASEVMERLKRFHAAQGSA